MNAEQVKQLSAPFAVKDHEFTYNKMIYLTEEAITRRMDEVDPNWSFVIRMTEHRADKVVIYAALTIAGVTRESNGFDAAEYSKGMPALPENEVNQREKAALTDALKRCARLFGIGRYILDIPKNGNDAVKDSGNLAKWLKAQYASNDSAAPATPEPAPQSSSAVAEKRKEAWRKFAAYWNKEQKLNNAKLCEILGVADLLEYDGNFEDANHEVLEWLAGMDEAENEAQS